MESIGRYRIIGELGRGAMGVVYHATDPSIGRSVAIKTIRIRDINDTAQRDRLRERLFREARSAGVLSHPNIVTIYDMDEVEGLAYIAMAYVNGPTLEKILSSESALSGTRMLRILRQTGAGLDYAHGRGIVHRDIKPANIMTDEDGAVKITDFGIAKVTAVNNMTETRTVVGTPNYMSPEQVQGLTIDGRSDQFSLAVIAYEILTGERPFIGEHLSTVVYKIVAEEPAAAQRINSTLTPQIDQVLRRGLAKKPEDRYPNCSSFVGALEMACAESRGWTTLPAGAGGSTPTVAVKHEAPARPAPPPAPRPAPPPPRFAAAAPPPSDTTENRAKRPSILVPLLLSVMVVAGVAAVIVWQAGLMPSVVASVTSAFGAGNSAPEQATAQPAPPLPSDPKPDDQPPPSTSPADAKDTAADTAPGAQTTEPAPAKPSPLAPAVSLQPPVSGQEETAPPAVAAVAKPGHPASPRLQDVWVSTNPPGAKAVLDEDLSQACQTPCMVHATPGVHNLAISQVGYESEFREIHIGDTATDVPPITLRKPSGTLLLTTTPSGANVRVDGKLIPQLTPTQITLAPGSYTITVEKGGRSQSQRVDIQQSPVYLKMPL
jgi:serine/threonine-protein kinase